MTEIPPPPPPILRRHLKQTSLSFTQESLWFLQQLDPENIAYNSTYLVKFTGGIERPSLERAINELVRRHEPLRTLYPIRNGRPFLVIQPFVLFSLPFVDYSGLPEDEQKQAIQRYVSEQGDQPFHLERGPLTRFAMLHTAPNIDYLFFCTHHIGFDAWSCQIFLSELAQLYSAYRSGKEPTLSELPIQYADYATWQREWLSGETLVAYIEHWKSILSGELPILDLPSDRPRPALQSFHGARYHFRIPQVLSSLMKEFCQRERMTSFQLLLSAYTLLLMRHSGQEDIIVGCPFANRSRPELDAMVGLFINTLPIRVNLRGNPSVREFLGQVRAVMLDAFTWQATPLEALVSEISPQRDLSRTPVFQVVINLRNVPRRQTIIEGMEMENVPQEDAPSGFDISLEFDIVDDGELEASFKYNVDLFNQNTIILMAAHYQNLLGELLVKIDRPIADLEMLTPSESQRIVFDWNNTGSEFSKVCIHDLITAQAEINPGGLAVVCNGTTMTYGDLEKKANQLAHYLRENGVGAEDRVGFYLPRSTKALIALLAILKAGGVFVPFDLTYPAERIAYMLNDSDPPVIITLNTLSDQFPDGVRKICLDTESDSIDACQSVRPVPVTDNNSLAYVIYTSGSTGRPKGTMNVHKGIVNYLTSMTKQFHFSTSDRFVQFASLSFDASVWGILGTLSYGGAVLLMDDDQMHDPDYIYTAIVDQQATYIDLVPTMLRAICESALAGKQKNNNLRIITFGGEILREADVELARQVFGESAELVNLYGPTECSIDTTGYLIPATLPNGLQIVPIGKPLSNTRVYVLDPYLHPVPQGVKGELFIGGIGVGRGYWNQPDLTAERFLIDPFWPGGRMYRTGDIVRQLPDGTICFLNRSDDQVKIRGYRVELSEIEAVIHEFPGVKDAAAVLWHQDGSETLSAYITVLEEHQGQIQVNVQAYLADRLPFYMLPSTITVLDEMPLTPNRKIDRRALPRPEAGAVTDRYRAPRNDIETRLVSIWKETLGVERVGIRDNFFELGGHSLLAVRLFARIQEEFGQSLPLLLLFKDGTVEAIAEKLTREDKSIHPVGIVPIQPEGSKVPIFIISPRLYLRGLVLALAHSGRPVYGVDSVENREVVYRKSVQETAEIYYHNLVEFFPQGPYLLLGHSRHGYSTLELARLLVKSGKDVAFLGLLDTYPPGSKRQAAPADRVKIHLDNLRNKNLPEILQYARLSAERFLTRWWKWMVAEDRRIERYEKNGQADKARNQIYRAYKPEPYAGQVTLFSASSRPWYVRWDMMENWANTLTGQLDIVPVPGSHMSMLEAPQVTELARKIEDFLVRRKDAW